MPQNKARKTKSGDKDKDKDKSRSTGTQGRGTQEKKQSGGKPQEFKNVPGHQS